MLDKYIGGSEENVRRLFARAEKEGPSILFFDEIDSIVPQRDSSGASVTDRVVNQFLVYLDGVEQLERTFVIAASSRPDLVDKAILRPGRLDTKIFCDLPKEEERVEYLKRNFEEKVGDGFPNEFFEELGKKCEGYSFSDLEVIFKNLEIGEENITEIREKVFGVIKGIRPVSVSRDFIKLKEIYKKFGNNESTVDLNKQEMILK